MVGPSCADLGFFQARSICVKGIHHLARRVTNNASRRRINDPIVRNRCVMLQTVLIRVQISQAQTLTSDKSPRPSHQLSNSPTAPPQLWHRRISPCSRPKRERWTKCLGRSSSKQTRIQFGLDTLCQRSSGQMTGTVTCQYSLDRRH